MWLKTRWKADVIFGSPNAGINPYAECMGAGLAK